MRIPHNEPLGSETSGAPPRPALAGSAQDSRKVPADPQRKCVLSGRIADRDSLIRLAISPDGDVLPDVLARAPGRGAWIGVDRAELETALSAGKGGGKLKGALARAFKGEALAIPDDLPARIEAALLRTLTDRLGLELRSGKMLTGSDRIAENARAGKVAWLAHAADAGGDGSRKLDQAWRVGEGAEGSGKAGTTLPLDRAALSVALGRDNVVHLALTDRAAAKRVTVPLQRLLHFQGRSEATEQDMTERTADPAAPLVATTD